jgi:hypothetical protein
MIGPKRTLAAAAAVVALAAGCGGGGGSSSPSPSSTATPETRPSSTAKLEILSPRNGDVVHGTTVHLRIALQDAKIVKPTTTNISPDKGHIHVLLDDKIISMTYGLSQTFKAKPGSHLLQVEFVASDHRPFDPRVIKAVTFEVKP